MGGDGDAEHPRRRLRPRCTWPLASFRLPGHGTNLSLQTSVSQIEHLLQTAEAIRRDGKPEWMQVRINQSLCNGDRSCTQVTKPDRSLASYMTLGSCYTSLALSTSICISYCIHAMLIINRGQWDVVGVCGRASFTTESC